MRLIKKLVDFIYLLLSDCDGMCDHCPSELKVRCYKHKNKQT